MLEVGCGTGNVLRVLHEACTEGVVIGLKPGDRENHATERLVAAVAARRPSFCR